MQGGLPSGKGRQPQDPATIPTWTLAGMGHCRRRRDHPPSPKPASPWAMLVTSWGFQGTPAPSPAPGPHQGGRVFAEVSTWGAVYTGVSLGSWSLKLSSSSPSPSK